MRYNGVAKTFAIQPGELVRAADLLLYAILRVKRSANIPLGKFTRDTSPLSDAELAIKGIIDAAESLGIDLGGRWAHEIDASEFTKM